MGQVKAPETRIAIFRKKEIRRIIYAKEWFFSVVDVIAALTDSVNPRDYWFKMKVRVKTEEGAELSTFCRQLKLMSSDGKKYETDCANTEGVFRIIQSIPSPKAEPFKRWLAKVGYERIQEIEDPELGTKRTRALYKASVAGKGGGEGVDASTPQVAPQVTPQVTPQVLDVLRSALPGPRSRAELQMAAGIRDREHFRKNYLERWLSEGYLELTIPDKPTSSRQKYRLTQKGSEMISIRSGSSQAE